MATKTELEQQVRELKGQLSLYSQKISADLGARIELQEQIKGLQMAQDENAELNKQLQSVQSTRDYYSGQYTAANAEIEQIQTLLDAMPGSLPRRSSEAAYSDTPVLIRLSVLLATRKVGV